MGQLGASERSGGTHRYVAVIEHGDTSWGAYVPDLPGCVALAETRVEVERLIREAIQYHLEWLDEHGVPIPPASSDAGAVEVAV